MGTNVRQNIVTNGLVLYLDAGNRMSYTSGSTTWNDLSGNLNSGSLVNNPTYSTENLGSLSTNGTNNYIQIVSSSLWNFGTSSFSIGVWYKPGSGVLTNLIRHDNALNGGLWWINTSTTSVTFFIFSSNRSTSTSIGSTVLNTSGSWHYVTAVRESGSLMRLYFESTLVASGSEAAGINIIAGSGAYPAIGRAGSFNGEYSTYTVSNVQIYNRALSAQEIAQNYNATKTRFGLT